MNTLYTNAQNNLRLKPLAAGLAFVFGVSAALAGHATTSIVNNCNDNGSGSLREAVSNAQSGDTVDLRSLVCSSISLTGGKLAVAVDDLVLQGPGSAKLTISSGADPIIDHKGAGTLSVDSLRIADGMEGIVSTGVLSLNESVVTGCGSGIRSSGLIMRNSTVNNNGATGVIVTSGDTTITGSTISSNGGEYTGGVFIIGLGAGTTVRIENTTISGNTAHRGVYDEAHAVGVIFASSVTIANSTVAFNSANGNPLSSEVTDVGALVIDSPQVTLESTIFANNSNTDLVVRHGTVIGGHNNLLMLGAAALDIGGKALLPADTLTADPLLQPLADNGGPTMTHALGAGSPAIDAGNNLAGLPTDQRGSPFVRSARARADIGAFEAQSSMPPGAFIGPGFTGSWYDPNQSGHGLAVEVLNNNLFYAMWFAFAPDGSQVWFGGVGTYVGNTAVIEQVALPTGGLWIPNFNPATIVRNPWGTLTFTFSDCNHGRVDFSSSIGGYGAGHMDLARLTQPAGLTCP